MTNRGLSSAFRQTTKC